MRLHPASFFPLPELCAASCAAAVFPWLTLRGLSTVCLEAFSADLRLTFRGLPAECLWVLPHEAASRTFLLGAAIGGPGVLPLEVLSRAPRGLFHRGDLASGEIVWGFLSISGLRRTGVGIAEATVFLGWVWAGSRPTFLAPFLAPTPLAGGVEISDHATHGGHSPRRGSGESSSQPRGLVRVCLPILKGRGLSVA